MYLSCLVIKIMIKIIVNACIELNYVPVTVLSSLNLITILIPTIIL